MPVSHLGSIRTLIIAAASFTTSIYGHPLKAFQQEVTGEEPPIDYASADFIEKMTVVMLLVLLGGAFAGRNNIYKYKNRSSTHKINVGIYRSYLGFNGNGRN